MSGVLSMNVKKREIYTKFYLINRTGRVHLGDVGVHWNITLKYILEK
jgi:hypothetical protein